MRSRPWISGYVLGINKELLQGVSTFIDPYLAEIVSAELVGRTISIAVDTVYPLLGRKRIFPLLGAARSHLSTISSRKTALHRIARWDEREGCPFHLSNSRSRVRGSKCDGNGTASLQSRRSGGR